MTGLKRILVLDDEPAIGELVCRVAKRAGIEARYCAQACAFLQAVNDWQPTHVFLDLVMPGLDGVEVINILAQRQAEVDIILVSGFDPRVLQSAERAARARGLSVLGVLPKPFGQAELRAMLEASPTPPRRSRIAVDPPTLDDAEFERALACDEFVLAYQPKWLLREQCVLGFEALVRWSHPRMGLLQPDSFIPQAERGGWIDALTEQVLRIGLEWMGSHPSASEALLEVNLSGASLGTLSPERISRLCAENGVANERVLLEVTETSQVIDLVGAADVLNRLRIRGFGLAIDDYGMGYSSLSQLALFPFTELKIDKMFVEQLTRSAEMRAMVSSTLRLAQEMNLTTVAEGVEDEATTRLLAEMGCDAVQGFSIARPMLAEPARAWLMERTA